MRLATTADDFIAAAVGTYFVGRRHLVFCHSTTLFGFATWGRPDVDDVRELLRLCEAALRPPIAPHRFLVDVRALEFVGPETFGLFLDYVRRNRAALAEKTLAQAQLRPDGLVGAILSGFSHVALLPYPERVFADVDEALAWLGVDRTLGHAVLGEIEAARSTVLEQHAIVARLRELLRAEGPLSLEDSARRLATSARTLQRLLRSAGTSHRIERKESQIRRARAMLVESDDAVAWIGHEVGFTSQQHFTTEFRRATGETPSAFRASAARASWALDRARAKR
jgi:AraC-like DNA-binding protein